MDMRELLASVLMALALLWVSATGGRVPQVPTHFPAQALSPGVPSAPAAIFTPGGQHARSLLTAGRQLRRGPGFQPLPFLVPAPLSIALPIAEPAARSTLRCAPARGARLLAHGPRAPPAHTAPVLFT